MKKRITLVFIVCLVALLAAALSACDPDANNPLLPEDPTISTYTVTFDFNGAIPYESLSTPRTVKYGDTIPQPLDDNGDPIIPEKTGYTFKNWQVNNTEFEFGKTQIVGNTTIKAAFDPNKYYHIPDIFATLDYDQATDSFTVNPTGHARKDGDNIIWDEGNYLTDSLGNNVKDAEGHDIPITKSDIYLPGSAIGSGTNIYSTYNATSSRITVPQKDVAEGQPADNFCFWYYLADAHDEDGNPIPDGNGGVKQRPVQYSEWAAEGADTVAVRSITYTYLEGLHLYAMFESDLPKVTVEYYEEYLEDGSQLHLLDDSTSVRLGKNLDESERFTPDLSATLNHQSDFELDYWYFVYETESEEEDGDPVINIQKFIFDKFDSDGKSTVKDATSPMDAAHDSSIPSAELNFRPTTLKLYARWIKKITITSAQDYLDLLYNPVTTCLATLAATSSDEERAQAQATLDDLLSAKIEIAGDLDFSGQTLKPLFDKDHPFVGSIDAGVYSQVEDSNEKVLQSKHTISNLTVEGEASASIFGYVDGSVKNLIVQNCNFSTTSTTEAAYLGAIASVCGGQISGCEVTATFSIAQNSLFAYIGGLTGVLNGVANDETKGSVNECTVTIAITSLSANGLCLGGIAGESGTSTSIANATATLTVSSVLASSAQGANSGLRIGGIAGNSVAAISTSRAALTLSSVEANGAALIGGIAGQNAGEIARSLAKFTLTPSGDSCVKIGSNSALSTAALGGLVGLNEGSMINSYSVVNFPAGSILARNRSVAIGGLVGSNSSALGDSESDQEKGVGAINRCYSDGAINVAVEDSETVQLYVGGAVGYSKHNKFARNFTLVNISVTYAEGKDSQVHAGFLFGSLDKNAVFTSGYYANENTITLNGKAISAQPAEQEAEGADDSQTDDGIFRLGTPRPKTDFYSNTFVFGTSEGQLGWVGGKESDNIWDLPDESTSLPTLTDLSAEW